MPGKSTQSAASQTFDLKYTEKLCGLIGNVIDSRILIVDGSPENGPSDELSYINDLAKAGVRLEQSLSDAVRLGIGSPLPECLEGKYDEIVTMARRMLSELTDYKNILNSGFEKRYVFNRT